MLIHQFLECCYLALDYCSHINPVAVCLNMYRLGIMASILLTLLAAAAAAAAKVRMRETRMFCRHDSPEAARTILREVRHVEGTFKASRLCVCVYLPSARLHAVCILIEH